MPSWKNLCWISFQFFFYPPHHKMLILHGICRSQQNFVVKIQVILKIQSILWSCILSRKFIDIFTRMIVQEIKRNGINLTPEKLILDVFLHSFRVLWDCGTFWFEGNLTLTFVLELTLRSTCPVLTVICWVLLNKPKVLYITSMLGFLQSAVRVARLCSRLCYMVGGCALKA